MTALQEDFTTFYPTSRHLKIKSVEKILFLKVLKIYLPNKLLIPTHKTTSLSGLNKDLRFNFFSCSFLACSLSRRECVFGSNILCVMCLRLLP